MESELHGKEFFLLGRRADHSNCNSKYVNITLVFAIIALNYMNINCKLLKVCYYMQSETYQHTYSKQF